MQVTVACNIKRKCHRSGRRYSRICSVNEMKITWPRSHSWKQVQTVPALRTKHQVIKCLGQFPTVKKADGCIVNIIFFWGEVFQFYRFLFSIYCLAYIYWIGFVSAPDTVNLVLKKTTAFGFEKKTTAEVGFLGSISQTRRKCIYERWTTGAGWRGGGHSDFSMVSVCLSF